MICQSTPIITVLKVNTITVKNIDTTEANNGAPILKASQKTTIM